MEPINKKAYETPELVTIGDVQEITKGEGFWGSDDQFWFIHWGTDPTSVG